MEQPVEEPRLFTEPTGAGALAAAFAPVALVIIGGVWLMLGGPPAVMLGAITVLPAFLLLAVWHILRTRWNLLAWTLDEDGFTVAPIKPGWFSRKPLRFDWSQVGAAQPWRRWGRSGSLLFLHAKPPSGAIRQLRVSPHLSRDAEFQRLIRGRVEPVRIEAGAFTLKARRRWPYVAGYVLYLLAAAAVVALPAVASDHAWLYWVKTLSFMALIAPCYATLGALAAAACLRLSATAALAWGSVAALTLLTALSVTCVNMRAPLEWLPASVGALAGLLAGIGVAAFVMRKRFPALRIALAYALCMGGFCAGWFADSGIPKRHVEGFPSRSAEPWAANGDGFALDSAGARWPFLTGVVWYTADGAPVRRIPFPLGVGNTLLIGQRGVLAETWSRGEYAISFLPRDGSAPVEVARDANCSHWALAPSRSLAVVFWNGPKSPYSRVSRVNMLTGEAEEWSIYSDAPAAWVSSFVRDDGRYAGVERDPPEQYGSSAGVPFKLNVWAAGNTGIPQRVIGDVDFAEEYSIAHDNSCVLLLLPQTKAEMPRYMRIDLDGAEPQCRYIEKTEYESIKSRRPEHPQFFVEKESHFPRRVFITDKQTGRRLHLRGLQPNASPPMWQPGGNKLLLFYMKYNCRFSDEEWWHALDMTGIHPWYRPGTLLVDLDSPEAKRLFGR